MIDGKLDEPKESDRRCPECGEPMVYQTWASDDGAHEDDKYTCKNEKCKYVLWVDGIDA